MLHRGSWIKKCYTLILSSHTYHLIQYEVRLKTVGYDLLYGKKASLQLTERWIGDELGRKDHNPNAAEFVQVVCCIHNIVTLILCCTTLCNPE